MKKPKRVYMKCSTCGAFAGHFQQWSNRDAGYGVCAPCVTWLRGRGADDQEIRRNFGDAGVHYACESVGEAEKCA